MAMLVQKRRSTHGDELSQLRGRRPYGSRRRRRRVISTTGI